MDQATVPSGLLDVGVQAEIFSFHSSDPTVVGWWDWQQSMMSCAAHPKHHRKTQGLQLALLPSSLVIKGTGDTQMETPDVSGHSDRDT